MTIKDLTKILNDEIEKGNGDIPIYFVEYYDGVLRKLCKKECGFYINEIWGIKKGGGCEKKREEKYYIIGNLINLKKGDTDFIE